MEQHQRKISHRWRHLGFGLVVAALLCPTLVWGQADQRVPVELKLKLADGKIKIGQTFVESLRNRINRSAGFRLNSSALPRLVFRISSEDLPGEIYLSLITVVRTVAIPWKGGSREIFLDNLVMVGVSAAHAGKDAEDILEDSRRNILPQFIAISGEVNQQNAQK
jgi:hypothetical protein